MLLYYVVKFRKQKVMLGKNTQAGHVKGSVFTLTPDLNKNDTKLKYMSANLPWMAFAGYVLFIGSRKEIS